MMPYMISEAKKIRKDDMTKNLQQQVKSILPKINAGDYRQIIEADSDEHIVALGLSWKNPFHPSAEYLRIYLDEDLKDQADVQRQLLTHLEKNPSSTADRLIYSLMNDQVKTLSTLKSNGYELIRNTCEPALTVAECLSQIETSAHSSVLTYGEMMKDPQLKNEFFTLLKRNYEATHLVNPAADLTLSEWMSLLLDEQPDWNLSLVGLTDGSVSSYITIFPPENEGVEIAWMGLRTEIPTARLELQQLFKKQLELLNQTGIRSIEAEIDTTDHYASALFSFIELGTLKSYDTYRKSI